MSDYSADRLSAAQDIREAGKAVVLRIPSPGTYDPVAMTMTPGTPADYPCHALEQSRNTLTLWDAAALAGTLVQGSDRFFMLAALTDAGAVLPTPQIDHVLFIGSTAGEQLAIKGVRALQPGNEAIFYEVAARG